MTEEEATAEIERIDRESPLKNHERLELENELIFRSYLRGWTGDPLQQPPTSVLACIRQVRRKETP